MSQLAITPRMLVDYVRGPRFFEARYILKSIEPHTVTTEEVFEQSVQDLLFTGECDSVTCPVEYLDSRGNMTTAAAKDWKAKALADGQKILAHSDWQNLQFAVDAARERMVKCFGAEKPVPERNALARVSDRSTKANATLPRLCTFADQSPLFLFTHARLFDLVDVVQDHICGTVPNDPSLAIAEAFYTLVIATALTRSSIHFLSLENKPPFQCLGVTILPDSVSKLYELHNSLFDGLFKSVETSDWAGPYEEEPYQI